MSERASHSRIAIICGAGLLSGKEVMTLELATGLSESGIHVECATSYWGTRQFRERLASAQIATHILRLGFISATFTGDALRMTAHQMMHWPGLCGAYRKFLRQSRASKVVHTNWHHLLLLWPLLDPNRDLFWLHESIPNKPQYRRVFGWLGQRLEYFVPVSQAVRTSLLRIGVPERKIRVVHNGLRDPAIGAAQSPLSSEKVVIGIVGQIGAWKGHDDLVEAFASVSRKNPKLELHVFGRGNADYVSGLKEKSVLLGVRDKIVWRNFVYDRSEIYRSMTVCVVPSRSEEPLPTVAIEAAFFEIPVIGTRRGGLPEIVVDGKTGLLVEAENPATLSAALELLIDDSALRQRLGRHARTYVAEKFARARFVNEFCAVLGIPEPVS